LKERKEIGGKGYRWEKWLELVKEFYTHLAPKLLFLFLFSGIYSGDYTHIRLPPLTATGGHSPLEHIEGMQV